jgi:MinD superfamily P-loop ATPase
VVVFGKQPLVFAQLCHGCGSCSLICPEKAITETPNRIGIIETGKTTEGIRFAHGKLDVGEPMAVPIIAQLKKMRNSPDQGTVIIDCPPGTSCPVVESVRGVDFAVLVTEPTPFGLHDLRLAVEVTEILNLPKGVIINRDGIGDEAVEHFCQQAEIPVLMRIPFDRGIGEALAKGMRLTECAPDYQRRFQDLYRKITDMVITAGEKQV